MPKTGTRPTRSATAAVGAGQGGGVARPVGEEHAVGLQRQDVVGGGAGGHHGDGPERREQLDHGGLDAEVVGHDAQVAFGAVAGRRVDAHLAPRDARDQVQAVGALGGRGGGAQFRFGRGAEGARDRTGLADMAGQAAGVDAGQGRDAVTTEEGLEGLGGAPVRRLVGEVAHHHAPAVRGGGLVVGGVGPVVADVGAGEGDDLSRVGRVRDHLLVAAHGGVEDELARRHRHGRARGLAGEHRPVGGHQQRRRPVAVAGPPHAHRCAVASITTGSPRSTV